MKTVNLFSDYITCIRFTENPIFASFMSSIMQVLLLCLNYSKRFYEKLFESIQECQMVQHLKVYYQLCLSKAM